MTAMENILFVAAVDAEAAQLPPEADVLITGIGTLNAAIALMERLYSPDLPRPDHVVNIGTAGALRDGLDGVFEVTAVRKHDFHLQVLSDIDRYLLPERYPLLTTGTYPDADLATGDMFVSDTATRNRLAQEYSLCDMEGYAIAAVCARAGVPLSMLKQVSDPANESSIGAWDSALERAAFELADAARALGFLPAKG